MNLNGCSLVCLTIQFLYVVWMWPFIKPKHTYAHTYSTSQKSFLTDKSGTLLISSRHCLHHLIPLFFHWDTWKMLMNWSVYWSFQNHNTRNNGNEIMVDSIGWIPQSLHIRSMWDWARNSEVQIPELEKYPLHHFNGILFQYLNTPHMLTTRHYLSFFPRRWNCILMAETITDSKLI